MQHSATDCRRAFQCRCIPMECLTAILVVKLEIVKSMLPRPFIDLSTQIPSKLQQYVEAPEVGSLEIGKGYAVCSRY